jgi:hypothetical protein
VRVGPDELDAARFERLVDDGARALAGGHAGQAAAILRQALSLWRGPALAELAFEPFAGAVVAWLEERRLAALEARIEADLQTGAHTELVGELRHLVAVNPTRERLAAQLMLALYRCGRQGNALGGLRADARVPVRRAGPRARSGVASAAARDPRAGPPSLELQRPAAGERAFNAGDAQRPFSLPSVLVAGAEDLFVGRAADLEWRAPDGTAGRPRRSRKPILFGCGMLVGPAGDELSGLLGRLECELGREGPASDRDGDDEGQCLGLLQRLEVLA